MFDDIAKSLLDIAAHILLRIELGFLRQVADLDTGLRARFTVDLGVQARHDAHEGRLAGAIEAKHANLGARKEGK